MNDNKTEYINTILALALIKYLYNKGKISESVYKNIKREYRKYLEKP